MIGCESKNLTSPSFSCLWKNSVKRAPHFDAWIDMDGGEDFAATVRDYIALCDDELVDAEDAQVDDGESLADLELAYDFT